MHLRNQKGMTLIEILLSIVILSIILVTAMKFFPQMGMMNNQNETKQQAVNDVKELLIDWQKKGDNLKTFLADPSSGAISGYDHNDANYYYFKNKKGKLNAEIKIKKTPDLNTNPSKAYLVHIKLKNDRETTISETYGYIIVN
ncbi:type IV pilus modification PilV family protein [Cytobacillus praedii]|uniref:Type II secretion system protein n=1 Tax=Cytobacillus praedii TaxID=1742358 RepID=A0A4R1ASK9_9BACI|nr:type II secretion system protein [Cytobacillus praedii]TCJ03103.1 type II secretion system protein [Cytobacillus praedii]